MVPVLIQDLAARNGVETVDHSRVCDTSVADYKCVMPVFGQHYLDPGTIALYISSFSALVSFVVSLSISPIADYGCKFILSRWGRRHADFFFRRIDCFFWSFG